jgi:hypothetical protein
MSQQINLFTPVFLKQPKYFSAATMAQALAAVLVGALGIYAYTAYQNRTLEQVAKASEADLKLRREQLVKFGAQYSPSGGSKLLDEEVARMEASLRSRQELLARLKGGEDTVTEGFSRYLSALSRRNVPGVWLTGFTLGGKGSPVTLKGRALRAELVPSYLQSIGSDETMRGRSVSELRLAAKEEAEVAAAPAAGPAAAAALTSTRAPTPAGAKPAAPAPAPVVRYVEFGVTMSANSPAAEQKPRPATKGAS